MKWSEDRPSERSNTVGAATWPPAQVASRRPPPHPGIIITTMAAARPLGSRAVRGAGELAPVLLLVAPPLLRVVVVAAVALAAAPSRWWPSAWLLTARSRRAAPDRHTNHAYGSAMSQQAGTGWTCTCTREVGGPRGGNGCRCQCRLWRRRGRARHPTPAAQLAPA
jgi:hypothetical protein